MALQRGEIYFVNLNPVQGREQAGQRPVLVLSIDAINRLPLAGQNPTRYNNAHYNMITNEEELAATQDRIVHFQHWLAGIRKTARPEEFDAVASGYRLEIERMQA